MEDIKMSKSLIGQLEKSKLEQIVKESLSINEALRKIGYDYTGGTNHKLFTKTCDELGIDYSHFTGMSNICVKRTEENVFCEDSTASQTTLREWYFKGEYSPYGCAICGINEWQGKPLVLRLDHINGHNKDNRLENLRWVCPNCDSQLDTFCRGYKGKGQVKFCEKCGKIISSSATLCSECSHFESRVVEHPSRDELKKLIREQPFTAIAKKYGVSDKAIVKWCLAENLRSRKTDIKKHSDEDWDKI